MRKIKQRFSFLNIDLSFFLLFILACFLDSIRIYVVYVVFIILHELSHFFVAKKLGYMPEKIHLSFFGASLEGYDDFNFYDEIKIVFAGPVFNLCVIVLCYVMFWFFPVTSVVLNDVLTANLSILFFNILPIYPLDMGRFLLAKFSQTNCRTDAVNKVKNLSFFVIICLFILFLI